MRRSLSSCLRPRHLGVSIATSLCAGAMLAAPSISPVYAAPTVGGDENGPQVQILQPGYQDVLKGKTKILIAVKAQKFNPQFVEMFIDDKPATTGPISITTLPSAQYDWDTKLFTDGPHKLTVRITDTQGFRGWAEVNVYINNGKKVDALPPSLAWKNITGLQELSGKSQIQLSAVDNFGVKWIIVTVNPASDPNKKPALRSWLLNRPPYVVDFDTTKVEDGLYQLSAKAWDSFDQEGAAEPLTVGVVNGSGVNATTVGEMLKGMRKMDEAQPVATKANAASKFTLETPDDVDAANIYTQRSGAAKAAAPAAPAKPAAPAASTPKVIVKQGAAAVKTPLQPSAPAMIVRDTKPVAPKPVVVAKNTTVSEAPVEVASPQLSTASPARIQASNPSSLRSEIEGAIADDYRSSLARVAVPEGQFQNVPVALMSAPVGGDLSISRMAATSMSGDSGLSSNTGRAAMPVGEMRVAARVEKPVASAPALSAQASKAVTAPRLAVAPKVETAVAAPSRLASPVAQPQRSFEGAAFSGSASAPSTRLSAKTPVLAKTETRKNAVAGKAANPDAKRVAALPRPFKKNEGGSINAITVSPIEIRTSDAIPAFHVAARATDLRAVAARYGLPVEVVAACNAWPQNKTLVAGEKVKLPQQLKVSYQGVPVKSDAPSMLVGGTGVTAFRFLFQQAGGKLEWDAKKQRVVAKKGDSEVVLTIGSNKAIVGDKEVMMELAAFLFEGRTMVPVRFFEEGLRAQVEWDPQTGRLVVAMAN